MKVVRSPTNKFEKKKRNGDILNHNKSKLKKIPTLLLLPVLRVKFKKTLP